MEAYGQAVVVRVRLRACVAEEFGNFHLEFDLSESRRIDCFDGAKGARGQGLLKLTLFALQVFCRAAS